MVLFGSRARAEKKADKFSDYDLIFFVSDVDYFIHTDEWLRGIEETMDLFSSTSKSVASAIGTNYPEHVEDYAREMVLSRRR